MADLRLYVGVRELRQHELGDNQRLECALDRHRPRA
jgi:hypothetical protein